MRRKNFILLDTFIWHRLIDRRKSLVFKCWAIFCTYCAKAIELVGTSISYWQFPIQRAVWSGTVRIYFIESRVNRTLWLLELQFELCASFKANLLWLIIDKCISIFNGLLNRLNSNVYLHFYISETGHKYFTTAYVSASLAATFSSIFMERSLHAVLLLIY